MEHSKSKKETSILERYKVYDTHRLFCTSLNMFLFHLNKSHEIKRRLPQTFDI